MPHKHTRRSLQTTSSHDLPPTSLARPLPTYKSKISKPPPKKTPKTSKPTPKRTVKPAQSEKEYKHDDTPRAFTRLITHQPPPRSGLDDGRPKRKRGAFSPPHHPSHQPSQAPENPRILPNESLSVFSARVDAALPVRGLTAKGRKIGIGGAREKQTKTERKMQRMQREWREEEGRRRARREEEEEAAEDEDEEGGDGIGMVGRKDGKKGGKGRREEEEDPWAGIAAKPLRQDGEGGLVGVHDVVLAPPKLKRLKGDEGGGFGGRKGVGVGLRRRAELGEARITVVEGYREMMKGRGR